MDNVEERLRGLKNADDVRRFLDEVCEPWGGVSKLDVVTDKWGNLTCFVDLVVAENTTRFYSVIKGTSYGNSFVFRIPAKES